MPPVVSASWSPTTQFPVHRRYRIPRLWQLNLLWILLVFSVVAWRQGTLFTGGLDQVVVLKALLQTAVLCWAILLWMWSETRQPVGARSIALLAIVLALSVIGAMADGNFLASSIIAVRVAMLAVTVLFIMRVYPAHEVLLAMCVGLSAVGIISSGTGLVLGGGGRLAGGIPPLSPNEIALLAGVPALVLFHQALRAQVRWWHVGMLVVLSAILLLSESRTALIAAACTAAGMLLMLRRIPLQTVVAALAALPLVFYLVFLTPVLQNLMAREDSASVMTLNSRTISWSVVLNLPNDSWQRWIGAGLSQKTIAVEGQYWDEQVFDSSWISLLAQTGIIGTLLVALWVLLTVFAALRSERLRSLLLPLLAFVIIRSVMENGLVDAGALFLIFMVLALMMEPASKRAALDWDHAAPLQRNRVKDPPVAMGN
ncbi:O-antigen ligase family protein [Arthrobacter sp. NIO-1057]|uniref:O-antigen ligase family protein n=1 Tax=Arthrobacter sp. NIO-1057 TaxID=993071 RepID=UPI000818580D|nr:O-antigen ligase family protein [Arthrobacter sp. NIO-1057]SCB75657.1 O-antigen ligase like membrane protein [Arthrobacter sp. NIO-1057]